MAALMLGIRSPLVRNRQSFLCIIDLMDNTIRWRLRMMSYQISVSGQVCAGHLGTNGVNGVDSEPLCAMLPPAMGAKLDFDINRLLRTTDAPAKRNLLFQSSSTAGSFHYLGSRIYQKVSTLLTTETACSTGTAPNKAAIVDDSASESTPWPHALLWSLE
jgi:hypothetical protein